MLLQGCIGYCLLSVRTICKDAMLLGMAMGTDYPRARGHKPYRVRVWVWVYTRG
jgi:hypothetical protein